MGRMALTMEPFGSGLALKTTCHSMIPMIHQENNATPHQSGLCRRQGGEGTMTPPVLLFRRECRPKSNVSFQCLDRKGTALSGQGVKKGVKSSDKMELRQTGIKQNPPPLSHKYHKACSIFPSTRPFSVHYSSTLLST
ncbi:hypothetical protein ATANTOWER_026778 [Ataeniobius toweri]|uniref:Uncharacterized protein n=1 Tax=Ataeniobius toweri TaxID=208326 RepID=A0ABU7ATT5_9TELE|nr:hypothetical protein [Ataeniobius toweri]